MATEPKVFHLQPDDIVLVGNLGRVDEQADLAAVLGDVRQALPTARKVFFFEADIDVDLLREVDGA